MNLISRAIEWVDARRTQKCVDPVVVITNTVNLNLVATIIEPESIVNTTGIRVNHNTYLFLFTASTLGSVRILPGFQIKRKEKVYTVVINQKLTEEYSDPDNRMIAIPVELKCS